MTSKNYGFCQGKCSRSSYPDGCYRAAEGVFGREEGCSPPEAGGRLTDLSTGTSSHGPAMQVLSEMFRSLSLCSESELRGFCLDFQMCCHQSGVM